MAELKSLYVEMTFCGKRQEQLLLPSGGLIVQPGKTYKIPLAEANKILGHRNWTTTDEHINTIKKYAGQPAITNNIFNFNNHLAGCPCFLIGSGGSIEGFDFARLNNLSTISINHNISDYPIADMLIFGDKRFLTVNDYNLANYKGEVFASCRTNYPVKEKVYIYNDNRGAPTKNYYDGLYHPTCTGLAALHLADIMGAKEIYLLGYDFNFKHGHHYFGKKYNHPEEEIKYKRKTLFFGKFINNKNIFNCNPDSELDIFPFVDIEQVLDKYKDNNSTLCTLLNHDFMISWKPFIKSLLENNPWFSYPITIIDIDLTDSDKEEIKSYYANINFIKPKFDNYKNVNFTKTLPPLIATYYKLDSFSLNNFDRVVFIDTDIIIRSSIKTLFQLNDGFYACKAYNASSDKLANDINSGVFVITKKYLNDETYQSLLEIARPGHSMPDQKPINIFFHGKIKYLDKKYNCEKRLLKSPTLSHLLNNASIIHFISQKPWDKVKTGNNTGFEDLEKIWHRWNNES